MVKKERIAKAHSHGHKHVTLHKHHAKPYRKRHVGLLVASLVGFVILFVLLVQYRDLVVSGAASSRDFMANLFTTTKSYDTTISSSYGFSLTYDERSLYANAVDGTSGKIYQDDGLLQERPYSKLHFAVTAKPHEADQSAVSVSYYPEIKTLLSSEELEKLAFSNGAVKKDGVRLAARNHVTIGGHRFDQSVWQTAKPAGDGPLKSLRASFSIYTANVHGHPFVIWVNEGFVDQPGTHPQYEDLLQSLKFESQVADVDARPIVNHSPLSAGSIVDTLLMTKVAAAESTTDTENASGKIAALYGPAVSQVYNSFCMDIGLDGTILVTDVCNSAVSGTGFFVSSDGYMATNGHVASMSVKDMVIAYALLRVQGGDYTTYLKLQDLSGLKESDIPSGTSTEATAKIVLDKFYGIEDSHFTKKNDMQNLLVVLGDKKPDTDKLIEDTKQRKKYEGSETIKHAEVKAIDYREFDGAKGFTASDVAILKVDGTNFPIVHLGSIDDVAQGDGLSILGFPGKAGNNQLVDSAASSATLTTGKVSAKKDEEGSKRKLIETDTTIGHGNSGGPAFADNGNVIGIATYTVDGSGEGNGTYNYIRDIKDFTDLASKASLTFDTNSETQTEWESGMEKFYTSHYSSALKNFDKVKTLYPNHNKADEFIASAKRHIANGEDVQDFPAVAVAVGAAALLVIAGVSVFLIVRHKKHHNVYKAGVAQGSVAPTAPGISATPQTVSVSQPTVQPVADTVSQPGVNVIQGPPATEETKAAPTSIPVVSTPAEGTTPVDSDQSAPTPGGSANL